MPLDDNDLTQIKELINKSNEQYFTQALDPVINKTTEKIESLIDEKFNNFAMANKRHFTKFETKLGEYDTRIEELGTKTQDSSDNTGDSNKSGNPDENKAGDPRYQEIEQRYNAMLTNVQELHKKYEESEKNRLAAEATAQRERTHSKFITKITDRVIDPPNFLNTLLNNQQVREVDGNLVVELDELDLATGEKKQIPAIDKVDDFLKKEYSYFAKPRPGTGGAGNTSNGRNNYSGNKYFTEDKMGPADAGVIDATYLYEAIEKGKGEEIVNEMRQMPQT